ncbi:MAG: serine hydrolase domain-containing protein [Caldilineaceae bacterium]
MNAMAVEADPIPQPLNAQTIAAFVDEFMQTQMATLHVPGAALVVVQGDKVLFADGYGLAELEEQAPVDVHETLFRAGSVSKLFTATAVMQLVEQGQVALDADVNEYLHSIQLPERFGRPVTVADLLLHTAGFDDVFFGMHVRKADELQSLADFLNSHLPERYQPPGEIISYNDHGYTLAGLLVEDVTGMRFDEYMAAHILAPLQMAHSTFAQPQPPALQARLAVGYRYDGRDYQPYDLDYVNVAPAAALVAPAAEMAHFIIAQLNGGSYDGASILQPQTVAAMQQTQFAHHPALRGRGYGFAEWRENGHRGVYHDGGNPGFLNRLLLLPDERVGFYLTFNSDQYSRRRRVFIASLQHSFSTRFSQKLRRLRLHRRPWRSTNRRANLPDTIAKCRPIRTTPSKSWPHCRTSSLYAWKVRS